MNLPRTVIISMTSLSCSNATGSLLSTIFHNWHPEQLLQITTIIPNDEITSSYKHYLIPKSLKHIFSNKKTAISHLIPHIFCLNWKKILTTVQKFKPDILYTRIVGWPLFFNGIALKLSQELNLPMACHIMDDYEGLFASSSNILLRQIVRPLFSLQLQRIINQSSLHFSISRKMSEAFSSRYGIPFIPIHNGIDPDLWHGNKKNGFGRPHVRLVHAGSLDLNKERKIIVELAKAISDLNKECLKYELILNTHDCYLPFAEKLAERYSGVTAQRFLPIDNYRKLLKNADILVLARNFDNKTRFYTQYSFQNKLPDYMASGTPILCIGPEWENSINFLRRHSAGKTVTESSVQALQTAIFELCQNPKLRATLAKNAKKIAFSEFNIKTIRRKFEIAMTELAIPR